MLCKRVYVSKKNPKTNKKPQKNIQLILRSKFKGNQGRALVEGGGTIFLNCLNCSSENILLL